MRPPDYSFEVHFKAFIPNTVQSSPGDPWLDEPGSLGRDFKTDDRGYFVDGGSARIHSWTNYSGSKYPSLGSEVGSSHMRWSKMNYLLTAPPIPPEVIPGYVRSDEDFYYFVATASKGGSMGETNVGHTVSAQGTWVYSDVKFIGEASYPFALIAPDIDYSIRVVCSFTDERIIVQVSGTHNYFPGYECYLKFKDHLIELYSYDPAKHGETGPGVRNLNRTWPVQRIRTILL